MDVLTRTFVPFDNAGADAAVGGDLQWRATRRLTGLATPDGRVPRLVELEEAARTYDLVVTLAESRRGQS